MRVRRAKRDTTKNHARCGPDWPACVASGAGRAKGYIETGRDESTRVMHAVRLVAQQQIMVRWRDMVGAE